VSGVEGPTCARTGVGSTRGCNVAMLVFWNAEIQYSFPAAPTVSHATGRSVDAGPNA
jgi:hypothetical protein